MEILKKEFLAWNKENDALLSLLRSNECLLYLRLKPVLQVLVYLTNISDVGEQADIRNIYIVGLEYIYSQFEAIKLYYEKSFSNDFIEFKQYEKVLSTILFLEDFAYEIKEKNIVVNQEKFKQLIDELETIIEFKSEVPQYLDIYVDDILSEIVDRDNFVFKGIIDIFIEIASTLGITQNNEIDFVLGKEI